MSAHAGPASQRTSACAPRVVRAPRAPVRIAYPARHVTSRGPVWIPGHYEEVTRRVWVRRGAGLLVAAMGVWGLARMLL